MSANPAVGQRFGKEQEMNGWKDFIKKFSKRGIVLLLAVVIVVSYGLYRSSDRTLRAGGFPEDGQTEAETGLGEELPGAGSTEAAPMELVLDEMQQDEETGSEEASGETVETQEESDQSDGTENIFSEDEDSEGSVFEDEDSGGEEPAGEDAAEVQEGSSEEEESSPAEGTGSDVENTEEDGSGDNFFTSEGDDSEEASGEDQSAEAAAGEEQSTEIDTGEEQSAEGDTGEEQSAEAGTGEQQTFFTTEDDAPDEEAGEGTGENEGSDQSSAGASGEGESSGAAAGEEKTFFTTEDDAPEGDTAQAAAEAGEGQSPVPGVADTLIFEGPDYTVTASYGEDAGIPAGASLVVHEITEESAEYRAYYEQAQTAVAEKAVAESLGEESGTGQESGSGTDSGSSSATADGSGSGSGTDKGNGSGSGTEKGNDSGSGTDAASSVEEAAAETEVTVSWVRLFDITIEVDGVAVEPQGPVAVQISYGEAIEQTGGEEVNTVHFEGEEEKPVVLETQTEGAGENLEQVTFETDGFSVFVVMGTTITKKVLASDGVGYQITLTCGADAAIPVGAELDVKEIPEDSEIYEAYFARSGDLFGADKRVAFARFFDITILKDGGEIQPAAPVEVRIELADELQEDTKAVHFGQEAGGAAAQEAEDVQASEAVLLDTSLVEATRMDSAVTFSASGFSVYGIVYTVDFHWEANGKTYDFSIPGGGYIALSDVFEALGIETGEADPARGSTSGSTGNDEEDSSPADSAGNDEEDSSPADSAGNDEEDSSPAGNAGNNEEAAEAGRDDAESSVDNDKEESDASAAQDTGREADQILAQNAGAGMETADIRAFLEGVDQVEFSSPELVWIGKAEDTITVGGLKKANGLEVQYSADLTEDQIKEINAQTVQAGDWALISLLPFTSEESLTVIMRNGDRFEIRVTDAQVAKKSSIVSGNSYYIYTVSDGKAYALSYDGGAALVDVDNPSLGNDYIWTITADGSSYWLMRNAGHPEYYLDLKNRSVTSRSASGITITEKTDSSAGFTMSNWENNNWVYLKLSGNKTTYSTSSSGSRMKLLDAAAAPQQAAQVTVHFVDRDGNALDGVSYTGSEEYPVTANEDGTFSFPYSWGLGNGTFTLHLDEDFSKKGYTYASTHLAGTRQGKSLTYGGLTMDAALKERGNALYFYADAGQTLAYGGLTERKLNDALNVPNESGTGETGYVAANTDRDIYVILDPVPTGTSSQTSTALDIQDPEFSKSLEYNEDGTYTLSLNVTGHGINAATNPKANVIFVVDTSSSMDKTEGTGTGHSRLHDTKPALKTLASELLLSNTMAGKDADTVEVAMVSFDGGVVDEIGWTTNYTALANQVDNGLALHRGTDWEDALDRAYAMGLAKQAEEPDQKVFVVFFTDGEGSQYRNFHGQGTYNTTVNPNYGKWYSYFLCRESAKDEARAIVNAGMQFYAIYAFNKDESRYNGEAGSDLLRNLVKYAFNSEELGNKNFFAKASNTAELEAAFNSILLSVREFLGISDVVINDDITSLTSTGINLVSSAVGGFSYTRSGGQYGEGTVWAEAPEATHADTADGDVTSVQWDLGSTVLEEGVTYTVSFKVWPSQEAYDWLANLRNGTKTWDDVVAAGLDAPDGNNPQIVKNGDSYSLLTNKPSLNSKGEIINNKITYKKTHSQTVTAEDIPAGTTMGTPIETTDENGNKTTTTYTLDQGVYTKTVVTERETYFKNPDPMPLVPERMGVLKKWETSMNTSHPADELKFRVLVDGKYYQKNGSLAAGDAGTANALVLPVSGENDWTNYVNIAPGIVKYYDDDGNALTEALVLETGHKYTVEEFDLMEGGEEFLYYTSYEFHAQTVRPMIVDGELQYLVLVDAANPQPEGAQTCVIDTETYYVAATGSGRGSLSGTNYRTAELDVTKIILNGSGADLTDAEMDAETFTYRVTLRIPDGTDPAGIVGYEYVPRTQDNAYTLFGYQEGELAFESDIERFSGKTFRAWNTLVYRDLVEWENVGGRIISKTDDDGNILWKVEKDADGYHSITYDMTLNRNEVIRFTNLPTGTKYEIQEIYANYYPADNSEDSAGHAPIEKASNLAQEGYAVTRVQTTNGTVRQTAVENDTVSGTIDTPNVRYYNQFTNELRSVKTQITILKTNQDGSKPLPGAVFDLYDQEGYEADPQTALKTGMTSSDEAGKEGTIDLGKLAEGTYYLVETAAPAGYTALSEPVTITVSQGTVNYSLESSNMDESGHGISGDFHTGYQLKITNDGGYSLPSTGGPGTNPFVFHGAVLCAVLALLAAAWLTLTER